MKLVGGPEKFTDEACVEIKLQKEISSTESNIAWPNKNETPKSKKVRKVLILSAQKLIPIITAFFLSGYSILAIYFYMKG